MRTTYGVHYQNEASPLESLRMLGYAVIENVIPESWLGVMRVKYDEIRERVATKYGLDTLTKLGEQHVLRCMFAHDPYFLMLARQPQILDLCEKSIGKGFILGTQNGVINPAGEAYTHGVWHRDLTYQHFTSSRPIAVNAIFCLDDFNEGTGATQVIPASHKEENLPSDSIINETAKILEAPAGSFIVIDAMTFHRGGPNKSPNDRRGINHLYSSSFVRQQISLPDWLGPDYTDDKELKALLGYNGCVAVNEEAYYAARKRKVGI